jgi:hypothetical protein
MGKEVTKSINTPQLANLSRILDIGVLLVIDSRDVSIRSPETNCAKAAKQTIGHNSAY